MDPSDLDLEVAGVVALAGPSPYYFLTVPERECEHLRAVSTEVTYGWGMIPVRAQVGGTQWTTSLFPKDGAHVVPLKDVVRRAEGIEEGDLINVRLRVQARRPRR